MKDIVSIFKAMGDETRLKILLLLSSKNICAKGIAKHMNISEAAVSQHIKLLKECNLITGYKEGYYVMYNINKESFDKAKDFISSLTNENIKLEINLLECKTNCKAMKRCCKKRLEEE